MKAVVHTRYGPPEVAEVKEVDKPLPKDDEVLIKIYASTVNRTDCGFRSAAYFISRFWSGLIRPKYNTLGCEFAGEIEEVGKNVQLFKQGDRVFGYDDAKFGGHAEYLTISEKEAIAIIPQNFTYDEAAPLTEGVHYALMSVRASKIKKGQKALVYGASGAIGSAAVQLLRFYGVEVTAVCNTKNVELVKSLGAEEVIDYQTQDFTSTTKRFDFAFDAVGKSSYKQCKPLLNKEGVFISTELGKNSENVFLALTTKLTGGKRVLFPIPTMDVEIINFLRELAENGDFRPVIDRTYNMEDIVEAYTYVESGQKTGNVVLKIGN